MHTSCKITSSFKISKQRTSNFTKFIFKYVLDLAHVKFDGINWALANCNILL